MICRLRLQGRSGMARIRKEFGLENRKRPWRSRKKQPEAFREPDAENIIELNGEAHSQDWEDHT